MFVKNVVLWNGIRKILQMNLFLRVRIALAIVVSISMFVLVSVIRKGDIMVLEFIVILIPAIAFGLVTLRSFKE